MTEIRMHVMQARYDGMCLNRDCRAPIYKGEKNITAVPDVGAFCAGCTANYKPRALRIMVEQRLEAE